MIVCAPWAPQSVLHGARIVLRPLAPVDVTELLVALDESREHFFPWLRFANRLRTPEDCHEHIVRAQAEWVRGDLYSFALRDLAGGRLLGGVDLFRRDHLTDGYSIGYWLRASEQGKGYMSEAVRLVTRFAFADIGANRVEIMCDARNMRSAAVARRLGFAFEGALRGVQIAPDGVPATMLLFARLPGDARGGLEDDRDEDDHA